MAQFPEKEYALWLEEEERRERQKRQEEKAATGILYDDFCLAVRPGSTSKNTGQDVATDPANTQTEEGSNLLEGKSAAREESTPASSNNSVSLCFAPSGCLG